MSSKWSWLKIVPLWTAIMSGSLSVFREAYGMFADNPIDSKSIFWQCARIAFIISAAIAWLQEHRALNFERAKNQKPEVSVKIVKGTVERSSATGTGYRGDRLVEEFKVLITLIITLLNVRPSVCSVDGCSLRIATPVRAIDPLLASAASPVDLIGLKIIKPQNIPEMEINVPLVQGIGATRFVQFLAEVCKDDRLANEAELMLSVTDSFGGQSTATLKASRLKQVGMMPLSD